MRSFFHQAIGPRANLVAESDALDDVYVLRRQPCRIDHVVYVIAISSVRRNPAGRSVRLLKVPKFFQLRHHVTDSRRTPAGSMIKSLRDLVRANRIAGQHMFLDNRGKHRLAARFGLRASGFRWDFRHYEDLNKGDRDSIANYGKWLQLLSLEVSPCA